MHCRWVSCCPSSQTTPKASASRCEGPHVRVGEPGAARQIARHKVGIGYVIKQIGGLLEHLAVPIPTPRVDVGSGGHQRINFSSHLVDANLIYVSLAGDSWKLRASVSTGKLDRVADRVADERTTLLSPGICRPTRGEGQQQDGWRSRCSFQASWLSPSRVDSTLGVPLSRGATSNTTPHGSACYAQPALASMGCTTSCHRSVAQDLPSEVAN